jgi:pyruvate formate lyase activating enzyme
VEQVLASIKKAHDLGIHVETRTNIIPGKNDDPEEHYEIACWIRDNLGADSPWHVTRFFPAYKLSDVPATPEYMLFDAEAEAKRAGLKNVYVYNDKGCDCATENRPIEVYLNSSADELHQVKQCAASCCGDDGVLLKKYEAESEKKIS